MNYVKIKEYNKKNYTEKEGRYGKKSKNTF